MRERKETIVLEREGREGRGALESNIEVGTMEKDVYGCMQSLREVSMRSWVAM